MIKSHHSVLSDVNIRPNLSKSETISQPSNSITGGNFSSHFDIINIYCIYSNTSSKLVTIITCNCTSIAIVLATIVDKCNKLSSTSSNSISFQSITTTIINYSTVIIYIYITDRTGIRDFGFRMIQSRSLIFINLYLEFHQFVLYYGHQLLHKRS